MKLAGASYDYTFKQRHPFSPSGCGTVFEVWDASGVYHGNVVCTSGMALFLAQKLHAEISVPKGQKGRYDKNSIVKERSE
jgi:hypothetical protein